MSKKPKPRSTVEPQTKAATFVDALKFIGLVTKDIGTPSERHIHLQSYWATATNGVLSIGHKITEEIYACPQATLIIEAMSKCGEHFSLTQSDMDKLTVKSNKFRAVIPCIDPMSIQVIGPDEPIAVIDDRLKDAFEAVGLLASENGQVIYNASVLLNGQSLISTNGKVLFEYWHGIDLPVGLPIPKGLIVPLTKTNKKLAKFGFSNASVTFFFEDESFIKSQLYAEPWPDVQRLLNQTCNPFPCPPDFFAALAAVAPFSEGNVYFDAGILRSHPSGDHGASYEVPGLPKGPVFPAKQLAWLKPYATTIDFLATGQNGWHGLMFYGEKMRGAISGFSQCK